MDYCTRESHATEYCLHTALRTAGTRACAVGGGPRGRGRGRAGAGRRGRGAGAGRRGRGAAPRAGGRGCGTRADATGESRRVGVWDVRRGPGATLETERSTDNAGKPPHTLLSHCTHTHTRTHSRRSTNSTNARPAQLTCLTPELACSRLVSRNRRGRHTPRNQVARCVADNDHVLIEPHEGARAHLEP